MLALPYPELGHSDTWGASVLAHALERAAQGRLRSVRGLIYGLRIDVTQGPSHGLMILRTETPPEAVGEVIQEVEALLTRIAKHGLPPALIDSARRDLVREWEQSLSSPQAAARRYAVYHRGHSLEDDRGGLEALERLSRPDSQALAMRYLGDNAARRWIVSGDPAQIPHLPVRWLMH